MRKLLTALFVLSLVIVIISCNKLFQKPTWDSEGLVPLANSKIAIENLIASENRYTDTANVVHLSYRDDIFNFQLEDDYVIPDTSYEKKSTGLSIPLNIFPGQIIVADSSESTYILKEANLTEASAKGGKLYFEMEGLLEGDAIVEYILHSAVKDGQPLVLTRTLPAATNGTPSYLLDSIDIKDYTLNLRGTDRNKFNTMSFTYKVTADPNGQTVKFKPNDYVIIRNSLKGMVPDYARGYFIKRTTKAEPGTDEFTAFEKVKSGTIDVENYNAKLILENTLGFDVNIQIKELSLSNTNTGEKKPLTHPVVGQQINLTRAGEINSEYSPPVISTGKTYELTQDNSNIFELLSMQPNKVDYDVDITVNPLGNVSNNMDFLYAGTGLKGTLDLDIPLSLSIEGLEIWDTASAQFTSELIQKHIISGDLVVLAKNSLPFEASVSLELLDENYNILSTLSPTNGVASANVDILGKVEETVESEMRYTLNSEAIAQLPLVKHVVFKATVNKGNATYVSIEPNQNLEFTLVGDFIYALSAND